MSEKETPAEKLARLESAREAHKAAHEAARVEQRVKDLEALEPLIAEYGEDSIAVLNVPFTAGLPTCFAVRVADSVEMKRYRARAKPRKADDHLAEHLTAANEELAPLVLVYPDAETFEKMCKVRPGIKAQAGGAAIRLTLASQENEGKD